MKKTFIFLAILLLASTPVFNFTSAASEGEILGQKLITIVNLIFSTPKYTEKEKTLVKTIITNCAANHKKTATKEACGIAGKEIMQMPTKDLSNISATELSLLEIQQEILRLVNIERAKVGIGPLMLDDTVNDLAQYHADDMFTKNFMSHTGSNGSTIADRFALFGISDGMRGENVAQGQKTPAAVVNSRMHSTGHRANILRSSFKYLGVGFSGDGTRDGTILRYYWVQNFSSQLNGDNSSLEALDAGNKYEETSSVSDEKREIVLGGGLTADEQTLYHLIMKYRAEKGLPSIPISKSLTFVAQTHAKDLQLNHPDIAPCNLHSRSDKGPWTPVCYTPDHAKASGMRYKPRELTSYQGYGYEISAMGYGSPEGFLKGRQGSKGHNDVIINAETRKSNNRNAIGVAIYGSYSVVWFGKESEEAENASNSSPQSSLSLPERRQEVVRLMNIEREKAGIAPLVLQTDLSNVAQVHVAEESQYDYCSPISHNNKTPQQQCSEMGTTCDNGLTIYRYESPESLVQERMNRANTYLLNPNYSAVGIGYIYDAVYRKHRWAAYFALSYQDPFQSNTSDITPSYEDPFQSTNTPHTSYTTPLFCESQRDGNFEGCVFGYEVFDAIATQACTRVHGKSTVVPRNWDTYVARAKARGITEVPFHTSYSYGKNSTISLDSVIQAFASQGLKASSGEAREKYEKGELREEAVCF